MNLNTLLQVATQTADAAPEAKMNLFSMAAKGGWIMIPLLLLGMLSVYILIERMVILKKASKKDATFMNKIKDYINEGKIEAALTLCKKVDTPYSRMIGKGVSRLGRPMNDVMVAVENIGNLEVMKLEKGLSMLATISGGAPLIGFLGTVVGTVQAFFKMESAGADMDVSTLSGGIYTAMISTAGGLVVGLLAYFAYNYLTGRISNVVSNMEAHSMEFMDILNEPAE